MKRKTWSAASVSTLLIVVAIAVVINLIGLRLFARADLTENKIYTLSDASRNVVANLEDRLTVKAYFTKDLPPPYNANARYVKDALEDYRSYGQGNFVYEFIDPADEAALEQEAQRYRVQPAQVNVMEKDNLQVKKVYMGLVLIYGAKNETIPLIQTVDNFEYEMTSTIKRLVADKLPKVGFLGGFGTPDLGADLRTVTTSLARHYEVVPVNTMAGNELIPEDIDVLCIVQPEQALDDWTKFCIDQFIMRGGKVGWFVNKVTADASQSTASLLPLNLDDFTAQYGFKIANNLILDANAAMINVQRQQGFITFSNLIRYAPFPEITNFSETNPIVKDLRSATLFFPSSVDTVSPAGGSATFEPLLFSSEASQAQAGSFDINPENRLTREDFKDGKKMLGVAIIGNFSSYFSNKQVPHPTDSTAAVSTVSITTQSPETRMIVFGEGNFLQGQYMQSGGPNLVMFLNALDWMAQDTDLLAIRSREAAIRPLDPNISDETKQTVKIANMAIPPLLVLLLGLYRWTSRRNRRKAVAL
jgi:gliding-associated putative ABC transporter substrate-binding component GldG